MAHKPETFKVDNKKKIITLYTNVEKNPAEETLINYYLSNGYVPMLTEKKTISVKEMKKELEANAPDVYNAFVEAYQEKAEKGSTSIKETGFGKACKIYTDWKKTQTKTEKKKK